MKITGHNNVCLRTVEVEDAEFILMLRVDETLNKHLSPVKTSVEMQKEFIKNYKEREAKKLEYYFIIQRNEKPVGTVRVYNIDYEKLTFTWGSWIVKQGNPGEVALSSAYITYFFAFYELGLNKAEIDVRKENNSVFEFYKTYCTLIGEDELNYYLELKKQDFGKFINKFGKRVSLELNFLY